MSQLSDRVAMMLEAKFDDPEQIMRELPDDQFRMILLGVAETFKTLKAEAVRRGIWDELKTQKLP